MPTLTVNAKRAQKTVVNEVALLVKSAQDKNISSSGATDIIKKQKNISLDHKVNSLWSSQEN